MHYQGGGPWIFVSDFPCVAFVTIWCRRSFVHVFTMEESIKQYMASMEEADRIKQQLELAQKASRTTAAAGSTVPGDDWTASYRAWEKWTVRRAVIVGRALYTAKAHLRRQKRSRLILCDKRRPRLTLQLGRRCGGCLLAATATTLTSSAFSTCHVSAKLQTAFGSGT